MTAKPALAWGLCSFATPVHYTEKQRCNLTKVIDMEGVRGSRYSIFLGHEELQIPGAAWK